VEQEVDEEEKKAKNDEEDALLLSLDFGEGAKVWPIWPHHQLPPTHRQDLARLREAREAISADCDRVFSFLNLH
jgi:hypothetical protein